MTTMRPFDLPTPPGARPATNQALAGTPVAAIGHVLSATSTVDINGASTNPEFGPTGMGRRISLTLLIAIVAFGFSFLAGMFASSGSTTVGALIALPPTIFFCWLAWRGMGKTRHEGTCVYIGTKGVEVIAIKKGVITTNHVVYLDAAIVTSNHTDVVINGRYAYTIETTRFLGRDLEHLLTVVGTYDHPDRPSDEALAAREVGRLAALQRTEAARAQLSRGETVVFPMFALSGRSVAPSRKFISLCGTRLEIHEDRGQPQVWDLAMIATRIVRGNVELVRRDNGHVVVSFERGMLGNADVLLALSNDMRAAGSSASPPMFAAV